MGLDPFSWAAIGVYAAIAGSATSAYSSYRSGQAQKDAADYQAQLNKLRAATAEQQGQIAQQQSDKDYAQAFGHGLTAEADSVLLEGRQGSSAQTWAIGAAREHATEKAMIAQQAEMQAWGFSTQATLDRMQGNSAARAGTMNATGTLLEGAGKGLWMWSQG